MGLLIVIIFIRTGEYEKSRTFINDRSCKLFFHDEQHCLKRPISRKLNDSKMVNRSSLGISNRSVVMVLIEKKLYNFITFLSHHVLLMSFWDEDE